MEERMTPPECRYSMEGFGAGYRKIIAALSRSSNQGNLLLLSTAIMAFITGIIVLFIDMPLPLMGALSVVSLVTLILFVAGARARFFPASEDQQRVHQIQSSSMMKRVRRPLLWWCTTSGLSGRRETVQPVAM